MAIPGRNFEQVEVRGKVRHGIKVPTANGGERPQATDYWVSDDAEIQALGKTGTLRIVFPYATADECFSSGFEWWKGRMLACYTKDGGARPVALRIATLVDADDEQRGEPRGQNRQPITCRADACPHFGKNAKNKECRPMARLVFFLEGGRTDEALQYESKAWDTIENVTKALVSSARRGPLNAPGRVFELTVEIVKKGRDQFPVCSLTEVNVQINTDEDVTLADAWLTLQKAVEAKDEEGARVSLAAALDVFRPGWREDEAYIARIKEVGVMTAAAGTAQRIKEKLA